MHTSFRIIIVLCITLLISYFNAFIYRITKIPDVIFLLVFGLLAGPVLGLAPTELLIEHAPLMGTVALSIILFEAGININVETLMKHSIKAIGLSLFTIYSAVVLVGFSVSYIFMPDKFSLLGGMLLGAMVGGTSTVATFGIIEEIERHVENAATAKVLLIMESIVSDPVCIITSIILINIIMQPDRSAVVAIQDLLRYLIGTFVFSSVLGLLVGILWAKTLDRLRGLPYTYLVTLSVLFPLYIVSELIIGEGGGVMAALFFGLGITNYRYIIGRLGVNDRVLIDTTLLRKFHEEMTFVIKSFFFVYIGAIVNLSLQYLFIGFAVVILLVAMRYFLVGIVSKPLSLSMEEKSISQVVYASGLPAFIMSQLPAIYDPQGMFFMTPRIYPDICMPLVLGTIIFSGLFGPILAKRKIIEETQLKEITKESISQTGDP